MDLPIRGLEDLAPLCAVGSLYLVGLVVLRLFIWPIIVGIRKKNALGRFLAFAANALVRILLLVGLAGLFIWSLFVIGLGDTIREIYYRLSNFEVTGIEGVDVVIPGFILLLVLLLYFFAIRPAWAFIRSNRR